MNLYSNPYCWTPQLGQSKVRINRLQIAIRGPFGMFCRTLFCDFHEIYKSIFNSPLQFLEYFFAAQQKHFTCWLQLLFPWCSMVKLNDLNDHWSKRSLLCLFCLLGGRGAPHPLPINFYPSIHCSIENWNPHPTNDF